MILAFHAPLIKTMHDLHLADKISKLVDEKVEEYKLQNIQSVLIELGQIEEHGEDISPENLEHNLKFINPNLKETKIKIIKKKGNNYWKLIEINGE